MKLVELLKRSDVLVESGGEERPLDESRLYVVAEVGVLTGVLRGDEDISHNSRASRSKSLNADNFSDSLIKFCEKAENSSELVPSLLILVVVSVVVCVMLVFGMAL